MFDLQDATEMRELVETLTRASYRVKLEGLPPAVRDCMVDANYGLTLALEALRALELEVAKYDKPEEWSR